MAASDLLMGLLVIDDTEGSSMVHQPAVDVVEEVLARTSATVAIHEREAQTVGRPARKVGSARATVGRMTEL